MTKQVCNLLKRRALAKQHRCQAVPKNVYARMCQAAALVGFPNRAPNYAGANR
jgi:hypothetical protein